MTDKDGYTVLSYLVELRNPNLFDLFLIRVDKDILQMPYQIKGDNNINDEESEDQFGNGTDNVVTLIEEALNKNRNKEHQYFSADPVGKFVFKLLIQQIKLMSTRVRPGDYSLIRRHFWVTLMTKTDEMKKSHMKGIAYSLHLLRLLIQKAKIDIMDSRLAITIERIEE